MSVIPRASSIAESRVVPVNGGLHKRDLPAPAGGAFDGGSPSMSCGRPAPFSLADLKGRPSTESRTRPARRLVVHRRMSGVPLSVVMNLVGVRPEARPSSSFRSIRGTASTRLASTNPAGVRMNGGALPTPHGPIVCAAGYKHQIPRINADTGYRRGARILPGSASWYRHLAHSGCTSLRRNGAVSTLFFRSDHARRTSVLERTSLKGNGGPW